MQSDIANLTGSVNYLALGGDEHKQPAQEPRRVRRVRRVRRPITLYEQIHRSIEPFQQSSETAVPAVESILSRFGSENTPNSPLDIKDEDIFLLRGGSRKLVDLTVKIKDAINTLDGLEERAILSRLLLLGRETEASVSDRSAVEKLLSNFNAKLKAIIREVLDSTASGGVLLRVAEECYRQATTPSGSLDPDDYVNQKGMPSISAGDESGSKSGSNKILNYRRCWIDFWIQVVNNSPGGPTLFHPSGKVGSEPPYSNATDTPPYLFRTFDNKSPGRSSEEVVSSVLSASEPGRSRIDLLTLEPERAIPLLHKHLDNNNPAYNPVTYDDNLVSWTNSLLFAIQYAVWRLYNKNIRNSKSDITICADDTTSFLQGQFVRDMWLIGSYYRASKQLDGEAFRFFGFRLSRDDYDNGEYLSQGALCHADRSSLVNLPQLERAGLYDLFPEFKGPEGGKEWYNRVKQLRERIWSARQNTSDGEIRLSLRLGSCFSRSDHLDMAIMLLTFKNRNLKTAPDGFLEPPRWATCPVEVRRYWEATEALKRSRKANATGDNLAPVSVENDPLANYQALIRGIFA